MRLGKLIERHEIIVSGDAFLDWLQSHAPSERLPDAGIYLPSMHLKRGDHATLTASWEVEVKR